MAVLWMLWTFLLAWITLNVCGWLFSSAITKVILFIIVTLRTPLHHMVLVGENIHPKPFLTISLENISLLIMMTVNAVFVRWGSTSSFWEMKMIKRRADKPSHQMPNSRVHFETQYVNYGHECNSSKHEYCKLKWFAAKNILSSITLHFHQVTFLASHNILSNNNCKTYFWTQFLDRSVI